MTTNQPGRTAVLIVRLWIEPDHESGVRARITEALDSDAPQQALAITNSIEGICDAVKHWAEGFVALPVSGEAHPRGEGMARGNGPAG